MPGAPSSFLRLVLVVRPGAPSSVLLSSSVQFHPKGCNCQHFAADLALALGAARRPDPVDERLAKSAASGANTLGAAGVSVAACAAAGVV